MWTQAPKLLNRNASVLLMQIPSAFFTFTLRELGLGVLHKNANSLVTAITLSDKLSFISDPGVSSLLTAIIKLWQAN